MHTHWHTAHFCSFRVVQGEVSLVMQQVRVGLCDIQLSSTRLLDIRLQRPFLSTAVRTLNIQLQDSLGLALNCQLEAGTGVTQSSITFLTLHHDSGQLCSLKLACVYCVTAAARTHDAAVTTQHNPACALKFPTATGAFTATSIATYAVSVPGESCNSGWLQYTALELNLGCVWDMMIF